MSVESAVHAWVAAGTGIATDRVRWAGQGPLVARPSSPGLWATIREESIAPIGRDWLVKESAPLSFADLTVASVDASANTLAVTGHGLATGDGPVYLEADGTAPGGLTAGVGVWVIQVDANTIRLAETFQAAIAATAIDITTSGSGAMRLASGAGTVRAGAEVTVSAVGLRVATYTITVYAGGVVGAASPQRALETLRSYTALPGPRALLRVDKVEIQDMGPTTSISVAINSVEWEPRATMVVRASIPSITASATGTVIELVQTQEIDAAGADVGGLVSFDLTDV